MGISVWWLLDWSRCRCSMQTTWLLGLWWVVMLSLQNNGAHHHYNTGAKATCKGKFPKYQMVKYMMDDVRCNGDENSLFECAYNKKHNCGKRERAGVNCISKCNIQLLSTFITRCCVAAKDDIDIRFWNNTEGQKTAVIELYYKGDWRFVCDHMWTVKDAQVACRQLKLPCSSKYAYTYYIALSHFSVL